MSTRVKKSLLALTTAMSLMLSAGMPAMAAENTYTSDGTANVPITATVSSSYTVVLPSTTQSLADADNDGTYTGSIHFDAFGKINTDKALVVLAGETEYGIGTVTPMFSQPGYAGMQDYACPFHMTGTTGGQSAAGMVTNTAIRFLSGGATPVAPTDRSIAAAKADTAPYEVTMEIAIPYTDTFTGNMPFSFGLTNVS